MNCGYNFWYYAAYIPDQFKPRLMNNRSGFAVFQSNHFSGKWELFSEFHKSLFFQFHWNSFLKKNPFKSLENYLGVSEDGLPRREHRYFNQKYLKSLTTPILSLFWIALGQLVRSDKKASYRIHCPSVEALWCTIYIPNTLFTVLGLCF